jgi:hypothetical protein
VRSVRPVRPVDGGPVRPVRPVAGGSVDRWTVTPVDGRTGGRCTVTVASLDLFEQISSDN